MKNPSYFFIFSLTTLISASPIFKLEGLDQSAEYDLSSAILLQELSSVLLTDLDINTSLMSPFANFKESDDISVIPQSHLLEKHLISLGLNDLAKYAKKIKLQNQNHDPSLEILIPEGATPFFIFNSSDSIYLPQAQSKDEYSKLIERSAPFQIPDFSFFIDCFLVLPISENFKYSKTLLNELSQSVITLNSEKLSLFKHELITSHNPLLVFLFKSDEKAVENNELKAPLSKSKSFVGSQDLNQFFDLLATTWVKDIGASELVHGVFCTLNTNFITQSYCIQAKKDLNNLALFPLYNTKQRKLEKQEMFDSFGSGRSVDERQHNNALISSNGGKGSSRTRNSAREDSIKLDSHCSQGDKPDELILTTSSQRGSIMNTQDYKTITWYNVFHHSVFGKTKFCGVNA